MKCSLRERATKKTSLRSRHFNRNKKAVRRNLLPLQKALKGHPQPRGLEKSHKLQTHL